MGRPRGFDEERALHAAMELFWQQGYDGTSLSDLVRATGASRASLYQLWGDKQGLYVAALERYGDTVATAALSLLQRGDPLEAIRHYFHQMADFVVQGHTCFVVDTVMHEVGACPAIARVTRAELDRVQAALQQALERAGVAEPAAHAHHLALALQGLLVQGRARPGRAAVDAYVRFTLSTLPPSESP